MKQILFSTLLCFSFLPAGLYAGTGINLKDYDTVVDFTGKQCARVVKGDNDRYKLRPYSDKNWTEVSLPSNWNKLYPGYSGICWYRLHIHFPPALPLRTFAIQLGKIIDADEVYFNGTLIGRTGAFPPERISAYDKVRIYEIPSALIKPGEENILAIRVAGLFSYANGPYRGSFKLGPLSQLTQGLYSNMFINLIFIIIYIVFGIYFGLFFIRRRKDNDKLLFSILSFVVSVYFFLITQLKYLTGIDFLLLKKIEYLALSLVMLIFMEFILFYFHKKHGIIHYIYWGINALLFSAVLITSSPVTWDHINLYLMQPSWIIPIGIVIYTLGKNFKEDRDAQYMSVSIGILILTLLNDILAIRMFYSLPRLTIYGFFIFMGSFAYIIDSRFIRVYHQVEDLNENLEKKVMERTAELDKTMTELKSINEYVTDINRQNEKELALAGRVQKGLISIPLENEYWESAVFFQPASSVSGDFYEFYDPGDGSIGVALADISGHGISAALITMIVKTLFYENCREECSRSLNEILRAVNSQLSEIIDPIDENLNYFITTVIVRCEKNRIISVNSAHPEPLLKSGGKIQKIESSGTLLGFKSVQLDYQTVELPVGEGDILLLYTDALSEGLNPDGEEFSDEKIQKILLEKEWGPDELIDALVNRLYQFTGTQCLADDLTLIVLKRRI